MRLFLALFACISLSLPAQTPVTRTFHIQWTKMDFAEPSAGPTISLPADVAHWVVGVKVAAGATGRVEIADATYKSGPYGMRHLIAVAPHPADKVRVSGSTISIGEDTSSDTTLLVFVELAAPRPVNITQSDGTPTSFLVSTAAVVADGSLVDTSLHGDFELPVIAFTLGTRAAPGGVLVARQQNRVLNISELRAHLSRYVDFAKSNPGTGPLTLVAQVHIGSDGTVEKVTCRDQSELCNSIESTIKQWSFQPYVVNDQPAPVVAEIPITVMPTGEVVSAISPGADLR